MTKVTRALALFAPAPVPPGATLLSAFVAAPAVDRVYCCDWMDLLRALPAQSVDLMLTDMPYGHTDLVWDIAPDLEQWWLLIGQALTPNGTVVATSTQPFTSELVMSNRKWFKYEWVWEKTVASGFLHAANKPMKNHENILIFSPGTTNHASLTQSRMAYFPQMEKGERWQRKVVSPNVTEDSAAGHHPSKINFDYVGKLTGSPDGQRYPQSVLHFGNGNNNSGHPTQKPVALFEYLIRTYTAPGDLVVDPFVGGGTTALAARNTGRHYICGDNMLEYVEGARRRLAEPYTLPMFPETIEDHKEEPCQIELLAS